ncbi:MAG: hypothetical protein FJ335_11040 [Sphingomonadales bacterium]|nr:hypothetical protein [Sphingomonadales bacterium]
MLVKKVRRYLVETGMPRTVFGRCAINDPRLVDDLMNGRQPRKRTKARIEAFIAANPEGVR